MRVPQTGQGEWKLDVLPSPRLSGHCISHFLGNAGLKWWRAWTPSQRHLHQIGFPAPPAPKFEKSYQAQMVLAIHAVPNLVYAENWDLRLSAKYDSSSYLSVFVVSLPWAVKTR